ncbi:MAG: transketolase [Saprospiraceae bacterium]|nr:transketolase [Saprospiraceae bacterium]MDP4819968.1 transketolase [Saprospiraceae bacterium]MDP4999835.1 transketolase [Saprospiraceae bacterium]
MENITSPAVSDGQLGKMAADNIRMLAAAMVEKAKSGHPGGPMGGADFVHVLFTEFLEFDPDNMEWPFRDRFILDPGHMSAMLYAIQHLLGNYSSEDIRNFRQWGSPTPGHPELDRKRGIENTSGPLGLGHAFGVGDAIAERFLAARFGEVIANHTYIYISDGGVQEEISQGVGRIAGYLGLGKVVMFYDSNDVQLSTEVSEVTSEDVAKKYEAWGWQVLTINGHDHDAIRRAIRAGKEETDRPTLIIGKTIIGKGAVQEDGKSYEGEVETHGKPLGESKASFAKTIANLGGDPNDPFHVFPEVQQYYAQVLAQKRAQAASRQATIAQWQAANPEPASKLTRFLEGQLPAINWAGIPQKEVIATRGASGNVLAQLAQQVDNMIVASADLCVSDKTDAFLKHTRAFSRGDFSGAFLQAGVSELTMAALCVGMALHGGVIPACATFFAFSDYMKPAIRVAALMELPCIFIWTHDSFRVGEDGPTHQPIEQEAQIRLLEKLKNHSGKQSFVALRPADAHETTHAWKMALENTACPTGLILSRQDVACLPAKNRFEEAEGLTKGAYVVKATTGQPDVLLLGNGSEVATLIAGAALLEERNGLSVKVVSAPSEGLFRSQPRDYQQAVIPSDVPVFGLTAGLPVTLEGLAGAHGHVFGLDHFGYSAPAKVLDDKLGFNPERVYQEVLSFLGK